MLRQMLSVILPAVLAAPVRGQAAPGPAVPPPLPPIEMPSTVQPEFPRASYEVPSGSPYLRDLKSDVIARVPAERTSNFRMLANRDMTIVAAMDTWEKDKWYIAVNSVVWEFYSAVDTASAQFSADGRHLALLAERDGEWFLVRDNQEIRKLGAGACDHLTYSPDGKRDFCMQHLANHQVRMVVEGQAGDVFDEIFSPQFSGDSAHLAYTAQGGAKFLIIKDGKTIAEPAVSGISPAIFSVDGNLLCSAVAVVGGQRSVARLVDGKITASKPLRAAGAQVTALQISADGTQIAWAEKSGDGVYLLTENVAKKIALQSIDQIVFSPDSAHIACAGVYRIVQGAPDRALYVDGQEIDDGLPAAGDGTLAFAQNDHVRFEATATAHDAFLQNGQWRRSWSFRSLDGTIDKEKVTVPGDIIAGGTLETGKAVVLYETPRAVNVNEKTLTEVTRAELSDK